MIDSHCHLSDARIYDHADAMISRALAAGVTRIGLGGTDALEWERQIALQKKYPELLVTNFGIHPWWIEKFSEAELQEMMSLLSEKAKLANGIGETGLDFGPKRDQALFTLQENYFKSQIELAVQLNKPLVLHVVHSHERVYEILEAGYPKQNALMMHRYSGSAEQMQKVLRWNAFISFSGEVVAEKGHLKTKEAFLSAPLDRLLLETDAPDQGAEPALINEFYLKAAKLRGITAENLKAAVSENFSKLYPLNV